ncbi:peptidyl-prolyl cis-trans isomerase cyp8 [Verticillium alfalfae VaMs.102]|uniref:Peptidyl-prolyl cis-trans isomerase-like 2 n=1 Tax=Verticillium alfalfae (strain VaMs.102 / ATCC MYA-4576 / FGSC 10136) TaxID=526221 RepID=C9SR76_VERA1|nr:peptidyl-prolyl cis-trans isomerase cyp8 [Verticillium alfalfae VaMs.102]EEY20878.1 peptidyl-prolyl cis-trans isomerase cyp8 [Verticillium alfalfae VaMs.102]
MGKGTDKLYITHSEWSSGDNYSASAGAKSRSGGASFRRLPFNFCAASLQPFKNPVCTSSGTIFDVEVIDSWLQKHKTNPVDGEPLSAKDLIRLNFARNAETDSRTPGFSDGRGDLIDPVSYKVFTDNTHIVAIRHGAYANVFAWDTVQKMNIKAKNWKDLVDDEDFTRADIITLQDPQNAASRDLSQFKKEERKNGNVNVDALGRIGDKVIRAKLAVEKARKEREAGGDVNRTAAGGALRALISDEEYMLKPKRIKTSGYVRIETNLGELNIELFPEFAPRAVWNFIKLAQKGYYNGVAFHRNIRNFMIQGGDPTGTGKGGTSIWGKNFQDEFEGPLTHEARGLLSMANKGKNTNSSQFFILYRAAKHLDRKHTIFGKVVGGLDVLSKIENVATDSSDRPINDIVMKNVVVYVDPFDEFQKQKLEREKADKAKEAIKLSGGTEDDRTTWTGKRLRADGTSAGETTGGGVGKYLSSQQPSEEVVGNHLDTWNEPPKKKAKSGGFGNFDNW